jgi:outer membrane protein assembly factor BamB
MITFIRSHIQNLRRSVPLFVIVIFFLIVSLSTIFIIRQSDYVYEGWIHDFDTDLPANPTSSMLSFWNNSLIISDKTGYIYNTDLETGKNNWRFAAQDYSIYPVSFNNDTAFITGFDGRLYALDPKTGTEKWRFTTPNYIKSDTAPEVSDGMVYFGSRNGILYALDESSGKVNWQFKTKPVDSTHLIFDQLIIHFGTFIIDENNIYINSATDDAVYALNKKTGRLIWKYSGYGFTNSKLKLFQGSISFRNNQGVYRILNKSDGKIIFQRPLEVRQICEGINLIYITNQNSVSVIDANLGTELWSLNGPSVKPVLVSEIEGNKVVIVSESAKKLSINLHDSVNGNLIWSSPLDKPAQKAYHDITRIYLIGQTRQCAYDIKSGLGIWCTDIFNIPDKSVMTENGIYLTVRKDGLATFYHLDKSTGISDWQFQSDNINPDIIKSYQENLFLFTADNRSLVKLIPDSTQGITKMSDLRRISNRNGLLSDITVFVGKKFTTAMNSMDHKLTDQDISVISPKSPAEVNSVYEMTINLDGLAPTADPSDTKISAEFTHPNAAYNLNGFNYDKNIWKIRFNPAFPGDWKWQAKINTGGRSILKSGSFKAVSAGRIGFIQLSKTNPRQLVDSENNLFIPIGIQDCTEDRNHDGNPLDQWFPGFLPEPQISPDIIDAYPMDAYLDLYAGSGFNIYRWGVENCSYPLWKNLSPSGNRYALTDSFYTDELFTTLKKHDYHIMMSLFSFRLPFDTGKNDRDKNSILKDYLDYIISRYAAYVDIWELSNEIYLDDQTVKFMSDYLKSNDPYRHPVTVNWEHPDNREIDIISLHWYDQECDLYCDQNLSSQLGSVKNFQKPVIFTEIGNRWANWDKYSADRFRVKLWLGLMNQTSFIYWNNSINLFKNTQGTSNIYLGPQERQYTTNFVNLTRNLSPDIKPLNISALYPGVKPYGIISGKKVMIYLYRGIVQSDISSTVIKFDLPESGTAYWINPKTNETLRVDYLLEKGQSLTSPPFNSDMVLLIELSR